MKIAIVGGGPAGSFCAIHLLRKARTLHAPIEVVIFDPKLFDTSGPGGCNLCAGVITRPMIENLKAMQVPIKDDVVQRRIDGFVFITEGGLLEIKGGPEDEFFSVFRGSGPLIDPSRGGEESFDYFLLEHAKELGAVHIEELVRDISRPEAGSNRMVVSHGDGNDYLADVVVGAFGVNSALTKKLEGMGFGYRAPKFVVVGQAEFALPADFLAEAYGGRIKVLCLKFPNAEHVKFVALTPKRDYVTVSLIGGGIRGEDIDSVFSDSRVLEHFPPGWRPPRQYCMCFPRLPYRQAEIPFADGIVMIGDAHVSRYYKNGIGSAFNTALWASENILEHGIGEKDFRRHYFRKCKAFYYRDNLLGRTLFGINDIISKNRILAPIQISSARMRRRKDSSKKGVIPQMLWSLFTGNRQYRDIIKRAISLKG